MEAAEFANEIAYQVIGCAIEVHKVLGPGLLEATYQRAMHIELRTRGLAFQSQVCIPAQYKGHVVGEYRIDLIVEGVVLVELKSVAGFDPLFTAQLLTSLRVTHLRVGLLMNFNTALLRHGLRRYVRDPSGRYAPHVNVQTGL